MSIIRKTLSNGMRVLLEDMPYAASISLQILLPCGVVNDPEDCQGQSHVLSELLLKGAGERDAKELSNYFDAEGIRYEVSSGTESTTLTFSFLPNSLEKVINISAEIIKKPHLNPKDLENVRQLTLQDLRAIEDDPSSKVIVEFAQSFYPSPFGRHTLGTEKGVKAINIESLKRQYKSRFMPNGTIVGLAGKIGEVESVVELLEKAFADWKGKIELLEVPPDRKEGFYKHVDQETAQVQIAMGFPAVKANDDRYYAARCGIGVLSGGMSGRLFVEVREKRGLVYSVSASHRPGRDRAYIFAYAGTTPENAKETVDVMLQQFTSLTEGIDSDELQRSKTDLKSKVVISGEIPSARVGALVSDWWTIGKTRSLQEISDAVERVNKDQIIQCAKDFPPSPLVLVTLGPAGVAKNFMSFRE